jgi:hypothetical protein
LVGLTYFGFESPWDAREDESATMPNTSNEDGRHLHQWSGEHVRDHNWPNALHNVGATQYELQPVR